MKQFDPDLDRQMDQTDLSSAAQPRSFLYYPGNKKSIPYTVDDVDQVCILLFYCRLKNVEKNRN